MPLDTLVAAAFVAVFGWTAYRTLRLHLRSRRRTGWIVAVEQEPSDDGDPVYDPVVRFTTRNGRSIQRSQVGSSAAGDFFRVGDQVDIRYSPRRPEQFASRAYEVSAVFWTFLLLVGVLLLWWYSR
jgi:hypothetical protein